MWFLNIIRVLLQFILNVVMESIFTQAQVLKCIFEVLVL